MEKEKNRKSGTIIALLLVCLIAVGCALVFEYQKNVELNEKLNQKSKESVESTINEVTHKYEYNFDEIECNESNGLSCEKDLNVYYDGSEHNIEIVHGFQNENEILKVNYYFYENNEMVTDFEGGDILINDLKETVSNNLNFSGYVYVFDSKYLGLVVPKYETETKGYDLVIINSEGKIIKRLTVDSASTSFSYENKDLDSIDNLEFDGQTLKVWDLNSDLASASQMGISIDNGKVKLKKLTTISNVDAAGQGALKFRNEIIED